ncbi:MAG: response regulator [Myxococcales bacterium]|nr:response regulator [Myxococcales bacterium]HIK86570.1 response regulator [Myxococcales bacterium]
MSKPDLPRILIVDDEEAILETMTFTFMDLYEVLTTSDPTTAMSILDENQPVSVVITDQRMPGMTGAELLKEVYARYPETVRIILTGFADSEATIKAINDGHIYGYINKPWEPDELKSIVRRASELHALAIENRRLVDDLSDANLFLGAVMDRLRTGAIAIDRDGIVRAVNKPAISFIGLTDDVRGRSLDDVLSAQDLKELVEAVRALADESGGSFEEVDLGVGEGHRVRISNQALIDDAGELIGRVILFKEISHEPLTRYFEEIVGRISGTKGALRGELETAQASLSALGERVVNGNVESANMSELGERVSRTRTAIENWLDVDDALAQDEYPDAQLLRDRLNVASKRWPRSESPPPRVVDLSRAVEDYYETGENARVRVL